MDIYSEEARSPEESREERMPEPSEEAAAQVRPRRRRSERYQEEEASPVKPETEGPDDSAPAKVEAPEIPARVAGAAAQYGAMARARRVAEMNAGHSGQQRPGAQSDNRAGGVRIPPRPNVPPRTGNSAVRPASMRVGYAPGRMGEEDATRQVPSVTPQQMRKYPQNAYGRPPEEETEDRREKSKGTGHVVVTVLVIVVLVIGVAVGALLLLPEENPIRKTAQGWVSGLATLLPGQPAPQVTPVPLVTEFTVGNNKGGTAPTDVICTFMTLPEVKAARLVDRKGQEMPTEAVRMENSNGTVWSLTCHLEEAYEGILTLQIRREEPGEDTGNETDGPWENTEFRTEVQVASPTNTPEALTTTAPEEAGVAVVVSTAVPEIENPAEATEQVGEEAQDEDENTPEVGKTQSGEVLTEVLDDQVGEESADEDEMSSSVGEKAEKEPKEESVVEQPPILGVKSDLADASGEQEAGQTAAAEKVDESADDSGSDEGPEGGQAALAAEDEPADESDGSGEEQAVAAAEPEEEPVEEEKAGQVTVVAEAEGEPAGDSEGSGETVAAEGSEDAEAVQAAAETEEEPAEEEGTTALKAEADLSAEPSLLIASSTIYSGSKKVSEYSRAAKELIRMPVGGEYTKKPMGVLTFRGDAFRQNAASGTVTGAEGLSLAWTAEANSVRGASTTYYGIGWTGQPVIVKWSKQVREASNLYESKLEKSGLKEVIIAGLDGNVHFLDLADGSLTRNSIKLTYPMRGTPSLHPSGAPYMNVGQFARKMKVKTGKIGLRQYNLYSQKEMSLIDGLDGKLHRATNNVGSFETSSLIDRTSDTMITAGTNGLLYLVSLGSNFDYEAGVYSQSPSTVVLKTLATGQKKKPALTAVEASIAMYDRYVYYADMGGILRCVDTDTLSTVWAVNTGDAVESTPALELNGDQTALALYTGNLLNNRSKGAVQIRRYDALSGKETWTTDIAVQKGKDKAAVGIIASPVVGQQALSGLVYYTVTGLNAEGREQLGLNGEEKSALVALDKEDGKIRWAWGMENGCESSPVAVYNEEGDGWIIQCASDGTICLMEGESGEEVATLQVEGTIEASPAVYNNMMVIGTTGKGTCYIYGIEIVGPESEEETTPEPAPEPTPAPEEEEPLEEEPPEEEYGEEEGIGE